ncbi:TPA: DUF3578 domain-containing protein [Aeromonas sobria]|nr:DUF3578 domain-containing protein [Aeromonas sobria]
MSKIQSLFKQILSNWVRATTEQFTNHPTAVIFRTELKESIENLAHRNNKEFKIKASVGAGNWANVPWVSILDTRITNTTQSGIYPVYLFCADGSGFYLSLNQGTTTPTRELGAVNAQRQAMELKSQLLNNITELTTWDNDSLNLHATTNLGRSYEPTNISAKYYPADDIPSDEELIKDLEWLLKLYEECVEFLSNEEYPRLDINNKPKFNPTKVYKPFLLFAGISGTGKTRFIREQIEHYSSLKNYCLVPVRPDWHEPSDLLGYTSRLGGKAEYIPTPVLIFIVKAWCHIIETIHQNEIDGEVNLDWEGKNLEQIAPFWLCLDEMNLAPVEQYFADYLSILETRRWYTPSELAKYNDQEDVEYEYVYECDPLLKPDVLALLDSTARDELAKQLGMDLSDVLQKEIWDYFCQHGIAIPFNLMVAGTVNMDETTHGFSRKVIDRALTFDFNEFFPNDFDAYFAPVLQPKLLGYPTWSDGRAITDIPELAPFSQKSIAFLKAVNGVLQQSPFELAYRALNELMLALIASPPADDAHLIAIWDDFMMCKVLPRIEGDSDKLRCHQSTGAATPDNLLTALEEVLKKQFQACWEGERPDLFNHNVRDMTKTPYVPCRSKKKLAWMKARLAQQCFTSFWP